MLYDLIHNPGGMVCSLVIIAEVIDSPVAQNPLSPATLSLGNAAAGPNTTVP